MQQKCYTFIHITQLSFTISHEKENFVNWYLPKGEINPTLIQFSNDTWLYLSGHNFQNNRYWCVKNPMLIHVAPLHDVKVHVCMTAIEINRPISFCDHNSHQLVTHSLDTIPFNTCLITNEHMPYSNNTMQKLHHKPFTAPSLNMESKNIIVGTIHY